MTCTKVFERHISFQVCPLSLAKDKTAAPSISVIWNQSYLITWDGFLLDWPMKQKRKKHKKINSIMKICKSVINCGNCRVEHFVQFSSNGVTLSQF